jgi:hypothetical protein
MIYTADNGTNVPGYFYPQWNPYNYAGDPNFLSPRGFAHEYAQDAASWQFNTYNRFSFWIKRPQNSQPIIITTGNAAGDYGNANVGTYCKSISACTTDPADSLDSDEFGGGHFYHTLTLSNNNCWTHVILNTQPDHQRGIQAPVGVLTHPTGESNYNYFDTFTRFYYEEDGPPTSFPQTFAMDDFIFYQEPYTEDDANIFSLTSNYNPANNELVITWSHNWNGTANQDVYYAFQDIHQTGLSAATLAPNGSIPLPNNNGYDAMVYDTTALPLAGHAVVYIAVHDESSPNNLFSEIMVPLSGPH